MAWATRQSEPLAGLDLIDAILARGDLGDFHLAHAARADLCRRLGRTADARASYERALVLAQLEPERRFLQSGFKLWTKKAGGCRISVTPTDYKLWTTSP